MSSGNLLASARGGCQTLNGIEQSKKKNFEFDIHNSGKFIPYSFLKFNSDLQFNQPCRTMQQQFREQQPNLNFGQQPTCQQPNFEHQPVRYSSNQFPNMSSGQPQPEQTTNINTQRNF